MTENAEHKEHHFFVDAKEYSTDSPSLTGAEIKARAGVPANYQLFLEEEGETPDLEISDGQAVNLTGKVKHFFAVPRTVFGAQ